MIEQASYTMTRFWSDERGTAMPEYALLIAMISIGVVSAMVSMSDAVLQLFGTPTNSLGKVSGGG